MAALSRDIHVRAILEFYKAGYITRLEKDKLIAYLYKVYSSEAPKLEISTVPEERELHYLYIMRQHYIELFVNDDFCVTYHFDKGSFTEALITLDN